MDIKIKKYNLKNTPPKELTDLLRQKYNKQENFDYFLKIKHKNLILSPSDEGENKRGGD